MKTSKTSPKIRARSAAREHPVRSVAGRATQRAGSGTPEPDGSPLADHRPEALAQLRRQQMADTSPQTVAQRRQLERLSGSPAQRQGPLEDEELTQGRFKPAQLQNPEEDELQRKTGDAPAQRQEPLEDEELTQGRFEPAQLQNPEEDELIQGQFSPRHGTAQLAESGSPPENRTGLPDSLKSGVENLSGRSLDDVQVHYNSAKPASLQALAYTQGTDIHVGPGQEQHLAHEAWHVAQQKQGRVRPTVRVNNTAVNDDTGLEHEADVMGAKAAHSATLPPVAQGQGLTPQAGVKEDTFQLMQWTWVGGVWYPDGDTQNPVPAHNGQKEFERFDDGLDNDEVEPEVEPEVVCPFGAEDIREKRGMAEDEARVLAEFHGMEDVSDDRWVCSDRPHSPKGRVYQLGNRYYGADNTGHVGFSFKIWSKAKKGAWTLDYLGNITHNLNTFIAR